MNDLPHPISPIHYNEIRFQDPSISDQDEESEETFDTFSDPDPDDSHLVDNNDSEFDGNDYDEDADPENDDTFSEFL